MFPVFGRRREGLCIVRTTVGKRAEAEALAKRLVDGRLAACVHVQEVASVYRWDGRRLQETEFTVEARTTPAGKGRAVQAMRDGHPYEVPVVESWPVSDVPPAYAAWAAQQVG